MTWGRQAIETSYVVGHFGGFPLRLSWLPRMVHRYDGVGRVPANLETIACDLGVGKNMAKSMRAWGRVSGVLKDGGQITRLGRRLFVDHDPFLERPESIAFLHWQIAANVERASAVAWAFNRITDDRFTTDDAIGNFVQHLSSAAGAVYSKGTVRGDVEAVIRMHTPDASGLNEDIGDRFFAQMGLLAEGEHGRRGRHRRTWENNRSQVTERVVEHALLSSLAKRRAESSSLSSLYLNRNALTSPGVVFGLTSDGFYGSVERICRRPQAPLSLSAMPGGDSMLVACGEWGEICRNGLTADVDERFFKAGS